MVTRLLIASLLILLPSLGFAADIVRLPVGPVVNDERNVFRHREVPGLWQRSALADESLLAMTKTAGDVLLVSQAGAEYRLYRSGDGLNFTLVWEETEPIALADKSFALGKTKIAYATKEAFEEYLLPADPGPDPAEGLFLLTEERPGYLRKGGGKLEIFDLTVSHSGPRWSYDCLDTAFIKLPRPLFVCDQLAYVFVSGLPVELIGGVTLASSSDKLALLAMGGGRFVIYDGADTTLLEFPDYLPGDELQVIADRLFYIKAIGTFEVGWAADPVTLHQLPEPGALRSSHDGSLVVLDGADRLYYSAVIGDWAETDLTNSFELIATGQGKIAYTPEDSDAKYEQTPGTFAEMDSSWAASSKIRVVADLGDQLLLILRNSSNNPNVYQSDDYQTWKRLTMPSQPTWAVSIAEARELPPDTLVEVSGKISVRPDIVGPGIGYLSDSLAGIQFFLSASKGQLGLTKYFEASAIGKISSAQVGRIILDSKESLIIGSAYLPSPKATNIAEATKNLAQTVVLTGELLALAADSATIKDETGELKLHLGGVKETFRAGDQIRLAVVVDYNSSSGAVEAWGIGEPAKLISRPVEVEPLANQPVPADAPAPATVNTRPTVSASLPTSEQPKPASNTASVPTKVAAANEPVQLPSGLTFLAGLLAGGLAVRGTRFGKYLANS